MICTKCGREHDDDSVFCRKCLDTMKNYPVKPDAALQLPKRNTLAAKKPSTRKKTVSAEELVIQQRKTIKMLWITLLCSIILLALSITLLFHLVQEEDIQVTIGQNYMTKDPATTD